MAHGQVPAPGLGDRQPAQNLTALSVCADHFVVDHQQRLGHGPVSGRTDGYGGIA